MIKKLMVYPFHKRIGVISRYAEQLKEYQLAAAVSPKFYGFEGKDTSFITGGKPSGVFVTSLFSEGISQCDSVLFTTSSYQTELNFYEEKMQDALMLKKEVLFTRELVECFQRSGILIPQEIKLLGSNKVQITDVHQEQMYVREIPVPVITIFQLGAFCNGLDTLLQFEEKFRLEEYKVCKVSSNTMAELYGIHLFPDYIHENQISFEDKIVNFNQYLLSLVEKEQPDILIIETEEPILKYNERITNHFGIVPLILGNSIKADISILNLYYDDYDVRYLNHLKSFCQYALNSEIKYIGIADTALVIQEFNEQNPVQYISVDRGDVKRLLTTTLLEHDFTFFSVDDQNSVDSMYDDIVDKLANNKNTVRIW